MPNQMFEYLTQNEKILVTGPQRSGTNICAQMVAYDTGYLFVSEEDLDIDDLDKLRILFQRDLKFVVHGPAFCRYAHEFATDDTLIVLVKRDLEEIYTSQERIDWCCAQQELDKYDKYPLSQRIVHEVISEMASIDPNKIIARVKYRFWDCQKKLIDNFMEVEYNDLSDHPLWVPREERLRFTPHQTVTDKVPEFER